MNRLSLLGALCSLLFGAAASAETHFVHPDGTGDFPTIQAALAAAAPGDEILLADGTFTGPGNRNLDFLGKAVTVRSTSGHREACVVDCEEEGGGFRFVAGEGPASLVADLTVTRSAKLSGAVETESASPTFRNVVISEGSRPVRAVYGAPRFSGCLLEANTGATSASPGVTLYETSALLEDCTLRDNVSPMHIAGGNTTFRNCDFEGNQYWAVVAGASPEHLVDPVVTLERCTFRENESGVWAVGATATIRDCVFRDHTIAAIEVRNSGGLILESCVVERNELGVELVVSAERTVEIRDCAFLENDTFAIRGSGDAVIERCRVQGNGGTGIFLRSARNAVVHDCRIQGNERAGVSIQAAQNVVVRDCLVTGNGSHGVKVRNSFPVAIERCTITSNRAQFSGGALHVTDGTVSVSHSILWGNCTGDGWEVWLASGSSVDLSCVNVEASRLRVFGEGVITTSDLFEADPLFCGPLECGTAPTTGGSWVLTPASPALHQPCGPMGVPGPLCPAPVGAQSGVEATSWARIKSRYR
jgi:parallel beta-helix repeat protein